MKLAFFIENSQFNKKLEKLKEKLAKPIFYQLIGVLLSLTAFMIVPAVLRVRRLAIVLTSKIV